MKIKWKSCFMIGVTIFVLFLCIQYWPVIEKILSTIWGAAAPLLIGGIIAYLVNILMSFYERHFFPNTKKQIVIRLRRPVCMILAFLTLIAIVVLIIALVVPELISCIRLIFSMIPNVSDSALEFINRLEITPNNIQSILETSDWKSKIDQIGNVVFNSMGSVMDIVSRAAASVFNGVTTGFLGLIFSFYLLLYKDTLSRQSKRVMNHYLKPGWCQKINYVLSVLNDSFRKYVIGQCTEVVILGVLCMIGMFILRLPYATMISALIAVTALIPVAGAYIGGIVGALMIFSVSPIKAVIFVIYLVILQQLEGNLIYPKVVGSSLGLPAIWVLAAITVGGGIAGILGMLLSVPIATALYRMLREDLNKVKKPVKKET